MLQDEEMRCAKPKRFGQFRMAAITAERETPFRLRARREIGDDADRDIEEELDGKGDARGRARSVPTPNRKGAT